MDDFSTIRLKVVVSNRTCSGTSSLSSPMGDHASTRLAPQAHLVSLSTRPSYLMQGMITWSMLPTPFHCSYVSSVSLKISRSLLKNSQSHTLSIQPSMYMNGIMISVFKLALNPLPLTHVSNSIFHTEVGICVHFMDFSSTVT